MKNDKIQTIARRVLFTLLASFTISNANMINGIALSVNEEPITTADIAYTMQTKGLKKADAVSLLIDEILFTQELEKQNVTVDVFEVNDYIEKIAKQNGMDIYTFKSVLRQQNQNLEDFEEKTKQDLLKRKLANKLVRGNIAVATEDDLKIYYENNQNMFTAAKSVEVDQYSSKNKQSLQMFMQNPMANVNDVAKAAFVLENEKLNSQLRYLLNETKENNFTPIFATTGQYVMFYVKKKNGVTVVNLEDVKEKIFNILMNEREQKFLKDYFEKLKLTADIKVIR